jgi:hypothetical protein
MGRHTRQPVLELSSCVVRVLRVYLGEHTRKVKKNEGEISICKKRKEKKTHRGVSLNISCILCLVSCKFELGPWVDLTVAWFEGVGSFCQKS